MKKKIPIFKTDEEARHFVDTANLTDYDLSGLRPVLFEFEAKAAQLNMRVPKSLMEAVKARAKAQGMPYTRFIRMLMEQAVNKPS